MTGTAKLTPNQIGYLLSKAEIQINMMKEMYVALNMLTCSEKTTFRQRQLNHRGLGEGDHGTRSHTAEPYSCLQVCKRAIMEAVKNHYLHFIFDIMVKQYGMGVTV